MRTLLLDVPDARCGVCRAVVVAALRALEGVVAAEVDLRRSLAAVTYDEARQTAAAIEDTLSSAGYPPQHDRGPTDPPPGGPHPTNIRRAP